MSYRRIAAALIALAVVGTALHAAAVLAAGTPGPLITAWVYCGVVVAAAAACLLRARAVRADRLAWTALGLGTALWALGEIDWEALITTQHPQPYPSHADVLYLSFYPLVIAGVLLLARGRLGRMGLGVMIDGAIAGFGAAALVVATLGPALANLSSRNEMRAIVDAAYPIFDVVTVACIAAVAAVVGWRRGWALLAFGLVVMSGADTIYLYQEASGTYTEGTLLDSGWLFGAAAIAIAAWQLPREAPTGEPGPGRAWVPGVTALIALGLLVVDHFDPIPDVGLALAAATLLLALVRLGMVLYENGVLLATARRDAITDALTGIANRRRLIEDLERTTTDARETGRDYLCALFDLDGFKTYNDTFGHAAGDHLLRRLGNALVVAVEGRGRAYRLGGDEFCVLAPLDSSKPDPIVAAAVAALREDGEGFVITTSHGEALIPAEARNASEALRLADARLYADKGRSSRAFGPQARDLLLGVLKEREPELRHHLEGVGHRAADLARRLGLDAEQIDVIGRAGDLHDIGKMAIPDQVLAKPGPLTPEEWSLMRQHTVIGERMLGASPALAPVGRLVRSSHERWDGGGYPDGLAGEEIPVGSRIIAICDAFEAMTELRPYREAVSADEALAELRRHAGTQFDPELVELFAKSLAEMPVTPVTSAP